MPQRQETPEEAILRMARENGLTVKKVAEVVIDWNVLMAATGLR